MKLAEFSKQPTERKDYDIDYAEWLSASNDTLDEVSTKVECLSTPGDAELVLESTEITTSRVKLWIRGGTSGQKYKVTVAVTTVGGRIDESELFFKVKDL